jgi:hypothetical protein
VVGALLAMLASRDVRQLPATSDAGRIPAPPAEPVGAA